MEKYSLLGTDGNAFSIIGNTRRMLQEAGLGNLRDEYSKKATSAKNYDTLLMISQQYIDKANDVYNKKRISEARGGVKRALEAVYNGFAKLQKMYPMKTTDLEHNGDIYFNNGNMGTDGDWLTNGHLSTLVIYDKKERPIYSITITTDGEIEGMIDAVKPHKIVKLGEISPSDTFDLAAILYQNSDGGSVWKEWFSDMDFSQPIKQSSYEALTEEQYEDEEEEEMWGHKTRTPRRKAVRRPSVNTGAMLGHRVAPQTMRKRTHRKPTGIRVNVRRMF